MPRMFMARSRPCCWRYPRCVSVAPLPSTRHPAPASRWSPGPCLCQQRLAHPAFVAGWEIHTRLDGPSIAWLCGGVNVSPRPSALANTASLGEHGSLVGSGLARTGLKSRSVNLLLPGRQAIGVTHCSKFRALRPQLLLQRGVFEEPAKGSRQLRRLAANDQCSATPCKLRDTTGFGDQG